MGFSGLSSQVIMFIAVISITSILVVVFNGYITETSNSITVRNDYLVNQLKSDISIDVISYNNLTNTTYVYVKNTGKVALKTENTDVYLNGLRVARNITNRTIEVLADTDSINPGIWDPKEEVLIKVFEYLNSSFSHNVIVSAQYEVKDSEEFSI